MVWILSQHLLRSFEACIQISAGPEGESRKPAFLVLFVLEMAHDLPEQSGILVTQLLLLCHVACLIYGRDPQYRRPRCQHQCSER